MKTGLSFIRNSLIVLVCTAGVAQADSPSLAYAWKNAAILAGGFVPGIVFSPVQKGLVYLRTDIGGFYRSNDAGQQWTPLIDWVGDDHGNWLGGESIAPDPRDANTVYAAAGMYSSNPAAILRSNDQGRSWRATPVPIRMGGNEDGRGCGERLGVDPNDTRVLYFGSRYDGLWKSTDAAVTWAKVERFPKLSGGTPGNWRHPGYGIAFVVFDPRSSATGIACTTLYAGIEQPGSAALYKSTDSGNTWAAVPGLPDGLIAHHGAIDVDGQLYLTLGDKPGTNEVTAGAVYKLDTAKGRWTDITPDKPTGNHPFGYAGLCLDQQHPGWLVVTTADRWYPGDDVFISKNAGQSWKPIKPTQVIDPSLTPYLKWGEPKPKEGWWMDAVAIDTFDSNHVMYGTGATVYGTHDIDHAMVGQTTHWTPEVAGIEETAAICLISPTDGAPLISGMGDVCGFVHDDLGVSPAQGMMSNPISGNTDALDFAQQRPSRVVRVGDKGGALSDDGGHTWTPFANQLKPGRGQSICISADGASILWSDGRVTHFSQDGGTSWKPSLELQGKGTVLADRVDPKLFFALRQGSLLMSRDGGMTFRSVNRGLPENGRLVVNPYRTADCWIAAGGAGLLRGDAGGTFSRVAPGLVTSAKLIAFGKPGPGQQLPAIYLAGMVENKSSIYRSDDGGTSWQRLEDDAHQFGWLPDAIVADPRVYGRVYLGTNGRGVIYGQPAEASP